MTFLEFRQSVEGENHRKLGMRKGQLAYNRLQAIKPQLALHITQCAGDDQHDPFYVDANLPRFWAKVEENWDKY